MSHLLLNASRVEFVFTDAEGKYTKLGELLRPEFSFTKAKPCPMTDLRTLKPGDRAVYNEDRGYMVVEIVTNGCTEKKEDFRLRVLGVLVPSPMLGCCDVGHEFDVFQLSDGYYAGRWHLRTFDDFAGSYEERRTALRPYEKPAG